MSEVIDAAALRAVIEGVLPIEWTPKGPPQRLAELSFTDSIYVTPEGWMRAALRVMVYDVSSGDRVVRDAKDQDVAFVEMAAAEANPAWARAALGAWARLVKELAALVNEVEYTLPMDYAFAATLARYPELGVADLDCLTVTDVYRLRGNERG